MVAGQKQQKQHAAKANQRFIWLGNLHLITAVMFRAKKVIYSYNFLFSRWSSHLFFVYFLQTPTLRSVLLNDATCSPLFKSESVIFIKSGRRMRGNHVCQIVPFTFTDLKQFQGPKHYSGLHECRHGLIAVLRKRGERKKKNQMTHIISKADWVQKKKRFIHLVQSTESFWKGEI